MNIINYHAYVQRLWDQTLDIRASSTTAARFQIAILRDGCGYRSREEVGRKPSRKACVSLLSAPNWTIDEAGDTERQLTRFLALSEIYAFTDASLTGQRDPMRRAHWDTTLALIEIAYLSEGQGWHQRMLLAGFACHEHAHFVRVLDGDVLAKERVSGKQLFEWQPLSADNDTPTYEGLVQNLPTARGSSRRTLGASCRQAARIGWRQAAKFIADR